MFYDQENDKSKAKNHEYYFQTLNDLKSNHTSKMNWT